MTKVRKPYTITKQRERWTGEEHERFLEALKLYGRAWRQIEEHVGTKTTVQIRSHAQKFFSKLEREGSSGSSKGPISEIDIPPPRPKRKPAHPYPRKGIALNSDGARMQLRSSITLGRTSSGCEVPVHSDDAFMEENKSPASNTPKISDQHPVNTPPEKISSVGLCQQPRKRGTQEAHRDAFPNECQETIKLSRSTCAEPELSSVPAVAAVQPDSPHTNTLPFETYGPHMAFPYFHPMYSLAAFPNTALLPNSVSKCPCQSPTLDKVPEFASLAAAHAQLGNPLMPWLNRNPLAIAAAAAAAATTLGPPPSPHLPLRPPSDAESPSAVAAAITAAAAASFADATAWLAFHGAFTRPPIAPVVRSLFKPNPVVHSGTAEGQQQQGLTNSSEGSKNGVTVSEQTSSEEHDPSTADGMQGTITGTNHPNPITDDDHSLHSAEHSQSFFYRYEEEASKNQGNKEHNSTDNSCNVKEKRKNGFIGVSGNNLLVESTNGLQKSAYITMNGKMVRTLRTNMRNDQVEFSQSMYQGSNYAKSDVSSKGKEGNGEGCAYKGKSNGSLDGEGCAYQGTINGSLGSLATSVHVIDCTAEEQSASSADKNKDCMASETITNTANMEIQVEIDVSMQHKNGWSHRTHEDTVARQCMSCCGSTEDKKDVVKNASLLHSKTKNNEVKECGADHYIDDSRSEIIPCEKAGKFQACIKRWQGAKFMLTPTCTNAKSTSEAVCRNPKDISQESMAIGLINGSRQGLSLNKAQSLKGSKASSSGSSKYSGHGFVPYRRN